MGLINSEWALVQVMAWRRSGDKPLSEQILIRFNDAYMGAPGGDELISFCASIVQNNELDKLYFKMILDDHKEISRWFGLSRKT